MTHGDIIGAWLLRGLLAALLFFGMEVLFWTQLHNYTALDWGVRVVGYALVSIACLDVLVRYRCRDIYDAMTVYAGAGLLIALLVAPQIAYAQLPVTLITRTLGGYTVLGFYTFGLLLMLLNSQQRRYRLYTLGFASWLGLFWGVWTRWMPTLGTLFDAVAPTTFIGVAALSLTSVLVFYALLVRHTSHTPLTLNTLKLSRIAWLLLLLGFIGLFMVQALQATLTISMVLTTLALLTLCWLVLWFRRSERPRILLERHLPLVPLSLVWLLATLLAFIGGTALGYALPLAGFGQYHQLWLMQIFLAIAGAIWLPLIATVSAARAMDTQLRGWTGVT